MLKLPKRFSPDFSRPGVKPTGPVEVDVSSPFYRGRLFYLPVIDPQINELTTHWQELPTGVLGAPVWPRSDLSPTGTPDASVHAGWLRLNQSSNSGHYQSDTGVDSLARAAGGYTWVIKVKDVNYVSQGSGINTLFGAKAVDFFSIAINSSNQLYVWVDNSSHVYTEVDLGDGKEHTISVVITGSQALVYDNGVKLSFEISYSGLSLASGSMITVGGSQNSSARSCTCKIAWAGIWNYAFSGSQVRDVSNDPYQQLKPLNEPYYFTASGAPAGEVLLADPATYSLGSDSVNFLRSTIFIAGTASYTLNSDPVNLLHGRVSNLDVATYSLGGDDVDFTVSAFPVMSADVGVYSLGSDDVTFLINRVINLDVGSYTLSGDDVTFTYTAGDTLLADVGVYSLGSDTVTFSRDYTLAASTASYNLTFTDANFTVAAFRTPDCFTYLTSKITDSEFLTGALDVEATFLTGAIDPNGQSVTGIINDDNLFLSGIICT